MRGLGSTASFFGKTLETDSLTVAKARLPKVLAELGRGSAKSVAMRSAGHPILCFGDAATLHLANIQARVALKPATKHYWNQVVAALLASWPDLAERKVTKVTEGGALAMKTYGHLRTEHALKMAKKVSF